ncbi:MAG TPA: amidohydrolase, partial [Thermotogota bacterium]|nr:amidohydrolase [Thermotogota bacterium]
MKWILKNAIIHPVTSETFRGSILIDKGKIAQINPAERKGTKIFDGGGLHLFPGIVEEHCHIGTHGEKTNQTADQDTNEWSEPITPEMHALDGIKIYDFGFKMALANGITTLNIFPGSGSPITGIGVALKNDPSLRFEERILIKESGLKMAFGENPKSVHSKTSKTIQTRMAT